MKTARTQHSIDSLFSILLFGVYVVFLLLMIVFCAKAYESAAAGEAENNNLHTAAAYVTAKFRTHDTEGDIYSGQVAELPALCMTDTVNDRKYVTYIYLYDGSLKELFVSEETPAMPQMGTTIATLASFDVQSLSENFFRIFLTDENGHSRSVLLHAGCPAQ